MTIEVRAWDAAALRRQAMEVVASACDSAAAYFRFVDDGSQLRYANLDATADLYELFIPLTDQAVHHDNLSTATDHRAWSLLEPEKHHLNQFATFERDYGKSLQQMYDEPTGQAFYAPAEISDQARALMFHGDEFLGFIAALRRGGDRFGGRELERLSATSQICHRLLHLARESERSDWRRAMHIVMTERGRVLFADERAAHWLTSRRHELLRRGLVDSDHVVIDGHCVTDAKIAGDVDQLRHVVLSPLPPVRRSALRRLSRSQRKIAELAAAGLTNEEIGCALGVSGSTVKYHLARIYSAAGLAGRQTLCELLDSEAS